MFVHYGDLLADTETEMRRIAEFCNIEVADDSWPALVDVVRLDAMRAEAKSGGDGSAIVFEGGADRFFFKGGTGRWHGTLTDDDLALYDKAAAALDPGLRSWLEGGRHAAPLEHGA